jgi:hypothetical protein
MTSVHAFQSCSLGCILMLSSHLHLGLLSSLFPSGLPTKFLYPFPHHACHMPHPSYSLWFRHPNNICCEVQITFFSYSAPLSTILLLPPFSAQISSLAPKYHKVSQPSETAGRIIVLCTLYCCVYRQQTGRQKILASMVNNYVKETSKVRSPIISIRI